jgi:nucleotide-binding universal stress UspA family protein
VNVLLAIDGSTCAEAAVNAVLDQFSPDKTAVRVVHVVEWPGDLSSALAFVEGPSAAASVLAAQEDVRRRGREVVTRAVSRLREAGFDTVPFILEGEVRHEVLEMAAAWPADTIVIGSHGRKGLNRFLLGSVSEGVLRHASCSVEVVRERPVRPGAGQLPIAS